MDTDGLQFANPIDNLTYLYDTDNKNLLLKVTDDSFNPQGFKDGTNTDNDYSYDDNGNLTKDNNKNIKTIKYNHLNLPTQIIFVNGNKISYLYNATGQKVNKVVTEKILAQTIITTTDYLAGFQYKNTVLQFFPHAEGYVNASQNGTSYTFNYVYNYTDHLGNIRLSYSKDPTSNVLKIIEENHYYPFGLKHSGYNSDRYYIATKPKRGDIAGITFLPFNPADFNSKNVYNYKYNGKEYQDELGLNLYDYGARNYDPALGRWMNVDPLAEGYENLSPYNYAMNNPMYFVDPDGMRIKIGDGYYSYVKNRNYDDDKYKDNRSAYEALDLLYSSGAANITFGEGDSAQTINIIDELIKFGGDVQILTSDGDEHFFQAGDNSVTFAEDYGIATATEAGVSNEEIRKAAETGKATKGVAFNSATAQLGHELLHAYNYNFDKGKKDSNWPKNGKPTPWVKGFGFYGRKHDQSTKTNDINKQHYKNGEEKYTTTLSNQINKALKESERWDHRGAPMRTESPTSNKPLKASAND